MQGLKSIKKKVLAHIAHLLFPYLLKEIYDQQSKALKMEMGGGIGLRLEGPQYITIGKNFHAGVSFRICAIDDYSNQKYNPQIIIGDNVSFEDFCHIGAIDYLEIGDGCCFASKVLIEDHMHGSTNAESEDFGVPPLERRLVHKPVIIGKNVLCGDGVCILMGVTIGDNVIIGANSVVTHNFPNNCVIAGTPARIIKML